MAYGWVDELLNTSLAMPPRIPAKAYPTHPETLPAPLVPQPPDHLAHLLSTPALVLDPCPAPFLRAGIIDVDGVPFVLAQFTQTLGPTGRGGGGSADGYAGGNEVG